MPIENQYIPLEGSRRSWWGTLTGLEKMLILLSATLAIFVFTLTLALITTKKCSHEVTTEAPITTTEGPITTEEPVTSDEPNSTEEPATTDEPQTSDEPETTEEIDTTEEVITEAPKEPPNDVKITSSSDSNSQTTSKIAENEETKKLLNMESEEESDEVSKNISQNGKVEEITENDNDEIEKEDTKKSKELNMDKESKEDYN
nr:300 kDa antigen AG231-like [Onthophagus taurus]